MEWLRAEIEFSSTFSYRMPDTSSQFALPCLLPGPSTVKLGLVATAILHSKEVREGRKIFELVKHANIRFLIPEKVVVFNPLIKRLKAKKEGSGFEATYGIRGYVMYSSPLILYFGIPQACGRDLQKISEILWLLRRLGTSDSLLTVLKVVLEAPPDSSLIVRPLERIFQMEVGGIIQRVKDISSDAKFEDVNIYGKSRKGALIERFYILPLRIIKEGGNWAVYERMNARNPL